MTLGKGNGSKPSTADLVCFSHLRWDFVYQRPQHLLSRFAAERRVFFIEEPISHDGGPEWEITEPEINLIRCVPRLPHGRDQSSETEMMRGLVDDLAAEWNCRECVEWYYTPMMLEWSARLRPVAVVYDCMDELSKFKFAPGSIRDLEQRLFEKADLVFTGGHSLYMAKKEQHRSVYEFPSSIDTAHFSMALTETDEMSDQAAIPHPRIGYAGVIDERIDLGLIADAADLRPDWNFVMIGPVVKIEPESLPQRPNIYYLGKKDYADLPRYFAGWDVGMMPFALNDSTEFISPTKTPEYLAAGLPVISTPITDVVRPYGELGLVQIAVSASDLIDAAVFGMAEDKSERLRSVSEFLAERSWDRTYRSMNDLINSVARRTINAETSPVSNGLSRVNYAA